MSMENTDETAPEQEAPSAPAAAEPQETTSEAAPVATSAEEQASAATDESAAAVATPAPAPVRKTRRERKLDIPKAKPKHERIAMHKQHETDVGSSEIQIGLLTDRILHLTEHLKIHPKDKHTKYGLQKMVSKRKRLLGYLERKKPASCKELKSKLNLR